MHINENTAIHTNKVTLVPYCEHHVPRYHEWMQDPDIRVATASEPLSLENEYAMQRSWRTDSDKLTFIVCEPRERKPNQEPQQHEIATMVGDVNLFILSNEEETGEISLVGEIEVMIGRKENQHRGLGHAIMLVFLYYILTHKEQILKEYFKPPRGTAKRPDFTYLRAKIGGTNVRSIALFESLGFEKTEPSPDFFDEFELRNKALSTTRLQEMISERGVTGYTEGQYQEGEKAESPLGKIVENTDTRSASSSGTDSLNSPARNIGQG